MTDWTWLRDLAVAAPGWAILLAVFAAFLAMYTGFAAATQAMIAGVLRRFRIGEPVDPRPPAAGQIRREVLWSLGSIAVFAAYGWLTVAAERAGLVRIDWQPGPWSTVLDLLLLAAFNEVHFYLVHRVLHTRWLMRHVHAVHHRSRVPTPWSTYAFHPLEAAALSSVMILLLLVAELSIVAVLAFPAVSLLLNTIGHANWALIRSHREEDLLAGARRHTAHHARGGGNYGFYTPCLDWLLGTRIRARGADDP